MDLACLHLRLETTGKDRHHAAAIRRRALEQPHLKQGRWLTTPSLKGVAGAALYGFTLHQAGRASWPSAPIHPTGRPLATDHGSRQSTRTPATCSSTARRGRNARLRRSWGTYGLSTSSFRHGPSRDRACDLGIKSPLERAAANCRKRNLPANRRSATPSESNRTATDGAYPVRTFVRTPVGLQNLGSQVRALSPLSRSTRRKPA
jgi:hypothetical protein